MSLELHIFMPDSRVPSRDTWQQAIEQLGFPTILDASLDVRNDTGFSPTSFRGQSTGFEFYLEPAADILSSYSHIAPRVRGRDTCATFRWGGDMMECGAALSAAAALAHVADGIYFYPADDIVYDAAEAVAATRRDLQQM
ncbi:MAG: hypothetical protein U0572_00350 [Phycisphaerales bacterium]